MKIHGNKGKIFTEEHKRKISLALTGVPANNGQKGKPKKEKTRLKISQSLTGKKQSQETIEKRVSKTRGSKHFNWKGGITPINLALRNSLRYKSWRKHVFTRDDYICQACGERGGKLQADHELPFSTYPDLRFEILNGRTLCKPCHKKTATYGRLALNFSSGSYSKLPKEPESSLNSAGAEGTSISEIMRMTKNGTRKINSGTANTNNPASRQLTFV